MSRITVFTPTYNRAYCLHKCYESLKRQTCKDFDWLIIDDGSTDNTKELVDSWISSSPGFLIRYIYKENGGLHTGYNTAIANIDTLLSVCIDSDDYMPDNAIELILSTWSQKGSSKVAGIVGLDFDMSGHVIGDPLPERETVNLIDLLIGKYGIKNGDRTNVVRTELYKKYAPMRVFEGEKNFNPHFLHLQISREYEFIVLNDNLRFVEYQAEGMSATILRQYRNSPNSFIETRRLYLSFKGAPVTFYLRHSVHLVSSCILAKRLGELMSLTPKKICAFLALPFGWLLSVYIRANT